MKLDSAHHQDLYVKLVADYFMMDKNAIMERNGHYPDVLEAHNRAVYILKQLDGADTQERLVYKYDEEANNG